jgi:hypothetical protein
MYIYEQYTVQSAYTAVYTSSITVNKVNKVLVPKLTQSFQIKFKSHCKKEVSDFPVPSRDHGCH